MRAPNLFDEIRGSDEAAIRTAQRRAAVCGETRRPEAREHTSRALTCFAIDHLLDATVTAASFEVQAAIMGEPVNVLLAEWLRRLRDSSAAAIRLLSRALEIDGRDLGYSPHAWEPRALCTTASVLRGPDYVTGRPERPCASEVARTALRDVSAALVDGEHDRMAMPGHLASAIGAATALFMLAFELLARVDAP